MKRQLLVSLKSLRGSSVSHPPTWEKARVKMEAEFVQKEKEGLLLRKETSFKGSCNEHKKSRRREIPVWLIPVSTVVQVAAAVTSISLLLFSSKDFERLLNPNQKRGKKISSSCVVCVVGALTSLPSLVSSLIISWHSFFFKKCHLPKARESSPNMDILPTGNIFKELQTVHETGFLSAQPSLEEKWQQVRLVQDHDEQNECNLQNFLSCLGWWETRRRKTRLDSLSRAKSETTSKTTETFVSLIRICFSFSLPSSSVLFSRFHPSSCVTFDSAFVGKFSLLLLPATSIFLWMFLSPKNKSRSLIIFLKSFSCSYILIHVSSFSVSACESLFLLQEIHFLLVSDNRHHQRQ